MSNPTVPPPGGAPRTNDRHHEMVRGLPLTSAFACRDDRSEEPSTLYVLLTVRAGVDVPHLATLVKGMPGVQEVHELVGEYDLLVKVRHAVRSSEPVPEALCQLTGAAVALSLLAGAGMERAPTRRLHPARPATSSPRARTSKPTPGGSWAARFAAFPRS